jgi:putative alpha-1,2-mannosidase
MRNFMITIGSSEGSDRTSFSTYFYRSDTFPKRINLVDKLNQTLDYRIWGQIVSIVEVSDADQIEFESAI